MQDGEFSDQDLNGMVRSFSQFHWGCWRDSEPSAARALARLRGPIIELMRFVVRGVLEEMVGSPSDPKVQSTCMQMLHHLMKDSEATKQLVRSGGGVQVLFSCIQHHPNDDRLLTTTLEAIDELHGVSSLLQALVEWKANPSGVRAALWSIMTLARSRWQEVRALPPHDVVRAVLAAVHVHSEDARIVGIGVELLSDLTSDVPEARGAFASLGGWTWLIQVLEYFARDHRIQRNGCRLLSTLGRGGSWADQHSRKALVLLERAMCQHESNDGVLYWAFWAVQSLNSARAIAAPMRNGCFATPSAMVAALKSLSGVSLGQGEGAEVGDMPDIIDAVLHAMRYHSERYDVLFECTVVLGHVTSFMVAACNGPAAPPELLQSAASSVDALVQLMNFRLADANSVYAALEAVAQIADACHQDSPVRASIRSRLFEAQAAAGGAAASEPLISRIVAAHQSNDHLLAAVMWVTGNVVGVSAVLQHMVQCSASPAAQLPAIKTLSWLYSDRIELEVGEVDALPNALRAVIAAMTRFSENIILQQHGCYALCAMVEHCNGFDESSFTTVAVAATEALKLVHGHYDGLGDSSSYNALYLRKEATRCIAVLCMVCPKLSRWLRDRGMHDILADALRSTADGVWDGRRDPDAEETLKLELLALSYVLGPQTAVIESLRRWGRVKPAIVRAAADAVVDLARSTTRIKCQLSAEDAADPTLASLAKPREALIAAGCGAELIAMMQAHGSDEDLQGRLQLACGFMGCNSAVPAS